MPEYPRYSTNEIDEEDTMMQRRNKGSFRSDPPVKVGDELDVKIDAVGEKGDGVAKKDGFVLFVPGAKQGQSVKIKVTRVLQKVGFAEIIGQAQSTGEEQPQEQEYSQEATGNDTEESQEDSDNFGEEEDKY